MGSNETAAATTGGPPGNWRFFFSPGAMGAPSGPNYLLFSDVRSRTHGLHQDAGRRLRRCSSAWKRRALVENFGGSWPSPILRRRIAIYIYRWKRLRMRRRRLPMSRPRRPGGGPPRGRGPPGHEFGGRSPRRHNVGVVFSELKKLIFFARQYPHNLSLWTSSNSRVLKLHVARLLASVLRR